MVTGIEVALISAAGKVLVSALPELIKILKEVLDKRNGLEGHVESLKLYLSTIQSFILDSRKIIRNDRVQSRRTLIANLRCVAYDMEDCLEGYRTKTIKADAKLYDKITELKGRVQDLIELVDGLSKALNPSPDQADASSSTTTSSDPQRQHDRIFRLGDLVSKEKIFGELLDLVQRPDAEPGKSLKVTVISIVSFGRIGRTNLCKQVYMELLRHNNNQSGQKWFSGVPVMISAAGKDENKVLEEIINKIPKQQSLLSRFTPRYFSSQEITQGNGGNTRASTHQHQRNQQDMINELAQRLGDKRYRYLILVDEVESVALAKFITSSLPENYTGSRIVMSMSVVGSPAERLHFDGQENELVNQAGDEAGQRDLFEIVDSSSLTNATLLLLMKRDGVPIAQVSISEVSHLNTDDVEEAWRQLRKEEADRWLQKKNDVLGLIYDNLDDNTATSDSSYTPGHQLRGKGLYLPDLQAGVLYFAMFPRESNVTRASLVRRWLAEGREFGGTSPDDAKKNLNCINQKFIEPLHLSLNNNQDQHLKACQPPEEVLDFIDEMSQKEDFIMLSCTQEDDIRRLSLHTTNSGRQRPTNDSPLPPRLRTLAVSRTTDACITECEQLRVLDLGMYPGLKESQFKDICKQLKLLKYLCLKPDHNITQVPGSIINLRLLETLDMGTDKVILVPIGVIKLPCLKHLLGKFELMDSLSAFKDKYLHVSKDIKESKLEKIAGFVTRKGQGFPALMCHMAKLWKVKIWFHRDADAERLEANLPEAITKFLKNDNIDRTLSLDFQDCPSPRELLQASLAKARGKLYTLKLSGENLSVHLFAIANTKLTGITKLCCLCCKTITLDATFLNELSKLNQLKYLKLDAETIEGAYDVNPQPGNNQQKVLIKIGHINKLERLSLVAKQTLPDIEIEPTALQQLVSLHLICEDIYYCPSASMICKANGQADAPLMKLEEVALNAAVSAESKKHWHQAARDHPNRPRIRFMKHPLRAG